MNEVVSTAGYRPNPMWELFLLRMRAILREPSAVFWVFVFPLLISLALGLAFRNKDLSKLSVAVTDGPDADATAALLDRVPGLSAHREASTKASDELRRGRVALVLVPGPVPELVTDPTQPDGRTARLMVSDALERQRGRQDVVRIQEHAVTAPGTRYIDFLIPGLLGLGLMSTGIWGIGWSLTTMRTGKLLKRLVATPMRRGQFLFSFVLGRTALASLEILFFAVFARLIFDVRIFGNVASFFCFAMLGALSFGGISLLTASRAQTNEMAAGLMNVVTMPMMVLSGVFFSADKFPEWSHPLIRVLPLTALNDGLRALMIDGSPIAALGPQIGVLAAWGGVSFLAALKIFRWG